MHPVGGEAVSCNLGIYTGPAFYSVFVFFNDQCSCAPAGNQSVASGIERSGGFMRFGNPNRKSAESVKTGHAQYVGFLCPSADDHVLQSLADKQSTQTNGMRPAGTGGADSHVDPFQSEYGSQVHGHRRIHRLEYCAGPHKGGILFFHADFMRFNNGPARRIVTVKNTHFVVVQVFIRYPGVL